jgi:hypothetical protein
MQGLTFSTTTLGGRSPSGRTAERFEDGLVDGFRVRGMALLICAEVVGFSRKAVDVSRRLWVVACVPL